MRIKARAAALLLALSALLIPTFAAAAPAQAVSQGYVYISMAKWEGNCPNGGNVYSIWAANGFTWSVSADTGDDLVYAKVNFYQNNPINYEIFCKTTWWGSGYYQYGGATIYPTRYGQTFWIGPWGQTHN